MGTMSSRDRNDEGLEALYFDALMVGAPDTGLLLRYLHDRDSLPVGERERIERYLEESPAHRDRLRLLERFERERPWVQSGEMVAGAARPAEPGGRVAPMRKRPFDGRSVARSTLGVVAAAAAAAAVLFLMLFVGSDDVVTPALGEGADARVADRPEVPARPGRVLPDPQASEPEALSLLAEAVDPESKPADPLLQVESREPGLAEGESAPRETTIVRADDGADVPEPSAASFQIAMAAPAELPGYRPPGVETRRYFRSAPASIELLAPPHHVALTAVESPMLYWLLDGSTGAQIVFELTPYDAEAPILELLLEGRSGIRAISLAEQGISLEAGVLYEWSVTRVVDGGKRQLDEIESVGIRYEPASAELVRALADGDPRSRANTYAANSVWYDAFHEVSHQLTLNLAAGHEEEAAVWRQHRTSLLEAADLPDVIGHDPHVIGHETGGEAP